MAVSLDSIERDWKSEIKREAHRQSAARPRFSREKLVSSIGILLSALCATPFVLAVGIFVPFFGQVLFLMVVGLAVTLMVAKRSLSIAAALLSGAGLGAILISLFAAALKNDAVAFYYLLLAFAVFVSIAVIVILIGMITQHYEEGRRALAERAE